MVSLRYGGLEVREQCPPAGSILLTPFLASGPEPVPTPVLDLDPGDVGPLGEESDLDLGGTSAVTAEVPEVGQLCRRLSPQSCSTPSEVRS